jgi:hypothetical protein
MDKTAFIKIPVSVCSKTETFPLFQLLLPEKFNEHHIKNILNIIEKLSNSYVEQNRIDYILAEFLSRLSFIFFNYILIDNSIELGRLSEHKIEHIKIGYEQFPLLDTSHVDLCITIMKHYIL